MLRFKLSLVLALLSPFAAAGQDITGQWQGILHTPDPLRIVLKVSRDQGHALRASLVSLDQDPDPVPVSSITMENGVLNFSIAMFQAAYHGKISAEGGRIDGVWDPGMPLHLQFERATPQTSWLTPSKSQSIEVAPGVSLDVIDWGGDGPPLVFLAGLGNTAHIFDTFAPRFTPAYHVYGITRRGFGESSSPAPAASNYSADQLGDDVLKVIDVLGLRRPVLIGHSIAGEELSSIATRYPDRVAALIYLDAGYSYALYSPDAGDSRLDAQELQGSLNAFLSGAVGADEKTAIHQLLAAIPKLRRDLEADQKQMDLMLPRSPARPGVEPPYMPAVNAIIRGERKYTDLQVPLLAIFASPHDPARLPPMSAQDKAEFIALDQEKTAAQVRAFRNLKCARVIVHPNADHYVFFSREQEVEREIKDFLNALHSPAPPASGMSQSIHLP